MDKTNNKKAKPSPSKKTANRISSSIKKLDPLIGGGFKRESIILVAGGTGCGKSILATQFLIDGIKNYNESGIYITFEERKKKVYESMLEFGWDLDKYEKEGKFVFLEYTPEQVKKILTEGGGIVENILEKMGAKRIVIDSITSFALLYEDELTKKEASLALFELIESWGCTALLTSQDISPEEETIVAATEFEVDGIILLYHLKRKGVRTRALEVLKMRGTKIPEKTFELEITAKGIDINPKKVMPF